MRTIYLIYIVAVACIGLSACSENEDGLSDKMVQDISLSAAVDEVKVLSRTANGEDNDGAYTGTAPSKENVLEAAVWFSTTSGVYQNDPDETFNLPIYTTIKYESGTATFPNEQQGVGTPKYPTNNAQVYCVGFYPKSEWDSNEAYTHATHAITGKQDLMFAPQIVGTWENHFQSQRFRHLLTWLKISVCTTTPEAGSYWGKLKSIKLIGVPTSLTVDLSKGEGESFNLQDAVDFSTEKQNLPVMNTAGEVELGLVDKEVASVFCMPNKNYTLFIECTNGTAKIEVNLEALSENDAELLDYPAGLQYVLKLFFHPFNVVEGVCTLNAWNAQNEDLYPNPSPTSNN